MTELDMTYVTPTELDLSPAHSFEITRPKTPDIRDVIQSMFDDLARFRDITAQSIQTNEKAVDELQINTQDALNDIDARLNYLSQQQQHTEHVLDAFIKLSLLAPNSNADVSELKAIVTDFLTRGLPPQVVVLEANTAPTRVLVSTDGVTEIYCDEEPRGG